MKRHRVGSLLALFVLALIIISTIVVVGLVLWKGSPVSAPNADRRDAAIQNGFQDPTSIPLPPPAKDPTGTRSFLASEGSSIIAFMDVTDPLGSIKASESGLQDMCRDFLAERLPAVGEPLSLLRLASKIPDRGLSELVINDIAAKGELLQRCARHESFGRQLGEAAFTHTLVVRRLNELGVDL